MVRHFYSLTIEVVWGAVESFLGENKFSISLNENQDPDILRIFIALG